MFRNPGPESRAPFRQLYRLRWGRWNRLSRLVGFADQPGQVPSIGGVEVQDSPGFSSNLFPLVASGPCSWSLPGSPGILFPDSGLFVIWGSVSQSPGSLGDKPNLQSAPWLESVSAIMSMSLMYMIVLRPMAFRTVFGALMVFPRGLTTT